jgi:hypothetical protein
LRATARRCPDTTKILQAWLPTGSAYTSNGIVELMKQLLAQPPDYHRIVFRADSGFFVGTLMDLLDAGGHGYLIKVKRRGLAQLLGQQHWTPNRRRPGCEQSQLQDRANDWRQARSFAAVRWRKESAPGSSARRALSHRGL